MIFWSIFLFFIWLLFLIFLEFSGLALYSSSSSESTASAQEIGFLNDFFTGAPGGVVVAAALGEGVLGRSSDVLTLSSLSSLTRRAA